MILLSLSPRASSTQKLVTTAGGIFLLGEISGSANHRESRSLEHKVSASWTVSVVVGVLEVCNIRREMRRYWGLALLSVAVIGVYSGSHTLRYYYTGVSSPGSGLPVFSEVGYVDDQEITNYNSDTRRRLPKAEWMKKLGPEYWKDESQRGRSWEAVFKHKLQSVVSRFNHTGGIHIAQVMVGCELRDDGSTAGYYWCGYDGRDFLYLDTKSGIYIPTMNGAQITTQRLNSPEEGWGESRKNYLENICIYWLKKYIEHGREDLEKRVRPEVKVWGRHRSNGVMRLHCLVYGFYPQAVDVRWMKNGVDHVPSGEISPNLPHPDGTYQMKIGIEVPTTQEDSYSCHVEHSSLEEGALIVTWEPDNGLSMIAIIAIVCAAVVIVGALGVGIFVCTKKSHGYKTTRTSDTSSYSFNNPRA